VRVGVAGVQVVTVVRRDERDPELFVDAEQLAVHDVLLGDPVTLKLQVVAVAEELRKTLDELPRLVRPALENGARDHAREATGRGDQALVVGPQELHVDARLVVEALEVALGDELHQIAVPLLVHREQDEVVDPVEAAGLRVPVEARALGDVDLAADDRLDARLARRLVELDRAEQVAVVGHGCGRHTRTRELADQSLDPDGSVQERELRVKVQVSEADRRVHDTLPPRSERRSNSAQMTQLVGGGPPGV
jgi:hypothetical protein